MSCSESNGGMNSYVSGIEGVSLKGIGFMMNDPDYHHVSPTVEFLALDLYSNWDSESWAPLMICKAGLIMIAHQICSRRASFCIKRSDYPPFISWAPPIMVFMWS